MGTHAPCECCEPFIYQFLCYLYVSPSFNESSITHIRIKESIPTTNNDKEIRRFDRGYQWVICNIPIVTLSYFAVLFQIGEVGR